MSQLELLRAKDEEVKALDAKLLGLSVHFESSVSDELRSVVDLSDLDGTHVGMTALLNKRINEYRPAASVLAARSYQRQREIVLGEKTRLWHAPDAPVEQVSSVVGTMLAPMRRQEAPPLSTAPDVGDDLSELDVEDLEDVDVEGAIDDLIARVGASADRIILNGARQTTLGNVARDSQATGWSRVTVGGGCAFCLMLASRGLVYRSRQTASFAAHDSCRCGAQPTFKGETYRKSPVGRAASRLWDDVETAGMSNKASISNYRSALKVAREDGTWDQYLADAYKSAYLPE